MKAAFFPLILLVGVSSPSPTKEQSVPSEVQTLVQTCKEAVEGTSSPSDALKRAEVIGRLKYPREEIEEFMFVCMVYIQSRVDAGHYERK